MKTRRNPALIAICLALLLPLVLVAAGCAKPSQEAAGPMVMRFADYTPPTGIRYEGVKAFVEKVQKGTNGRIKIEEYWSDSLVTAPELLAAAQKGTADIVVDSWGKHTSELPNWQVFNSLPEFPAPSGRTALFEKAMAEIPELVADYDKLNQKIIGFQFLPYLNVGMVKPVATIWDMKGMTIRSSSPSQAALVKAAGGVPVDMPTADVYSALERGTVDGIFTHIEVQYRMKFSEKTKTIFLLNQMWAGQENIFSINKDSFNKLSKADQKVLLDAAKEMTAHFVGALDKDASMWLASFEKAGAKNVQVPAADQKKWASSPEVAALADQWAAKAPNRPEMLKKVRALVAEALK